MRRIRLVVVVGVVMAAMLALSAGPAMADDFDGFLDRDFDHNGFDDGFNETLLLAEGTPAFEQWCSPGLPDGIFIPGCIFSDPLEDDDIDFRFIDDGDLCDDDDLFDDDGDFCDDDDNDAVVLLVDDDDHFFDDGGRDRDRDRDHPRRNHNR